MTSRDFVYWLQGLFELQDPKMLDEHQTKLIKQHLSLVFIHEIDPSVPTEQQDALNTAHGSAPMTIKDLKKRLEEHKKRPNPFRPPGARC